MVLSNLLGSDGAGFKAGKKGGSHLTVDDVAFQWNIIYGSLAESSRCAYGFWKI